jgi:hypothetical protein
MADADGEMLKPKRPAKRRKAAALPDTPDPIEIAMAEVNSGSAGTGAAQLLLEKQARLIDADLVHRRWQIATERAAAAFKAVLALGGLALLLAAGLFIWSARQANGLVLDPFEVPPEMAARGLSGPVVAGQMLDHLRRMQGQTDTSRAVATFGGGWGDDIRMEIPNTGVSVGELRRYLIGWLGRQTRITGEVFRQADGTIAVTARVGNEAGQRLVGRAEEIDSLLARSAEGVYAQTHPFLYSQWLGQKGRVEEENAVLQRLLLQPDETERLWALTRLADRETSFDGQRRYAEAALRIRNDFMPAMSALAWAHNQAGHLEEALRLFAEMERNRNRLRAQIKPELADQTLLIAEGWRTIHMGDHLASARVSRAVANLQTGGTARDMSALYSARGWAQAHDITRARSVLDEAAFGPAGLDALIGRFGRENDPRLWFDIGLGDWRSAAAKFLAVEVPHADHHLRSVQAIVAAKGGRVDRAMAILRTMPNDHYEGVVARGVTAAAAGRPGLADRYFREAARQGPSLPSAHYWRADALLARRDTAGAIGEAQLAHQKGPRWAEPLKLWGDALMRRGEAGAAADRYAAAADLTPRWGALHIEWGKALWRSGEREEARAKLRAAARMDLSTTDRARLRRIWAAANGRAI